MGWLSRLRNRKTEVVESVETDLSSLMWDSIDDMPIYNWFKLSKKRDYNQLLKEYDELYTEENHSIFEQRSNQLTQEYLDTFGADQDTEMLLIHLQTKNRLLYDLLSTGNKFIKIQITMVEDEIRKLLPDEEDEGLSGIDNSLVRVSKYMGYGVYSKLISVSRYKYLILYIEEENKKAEKWQNNQ